MRPHVGVEDDGVARPQLAGGAVDADFYMAADDSQILPCAGQMLVGILMPRRLKPQLVKLHAPSRFERKQRA